MKGLNKRSLLVNIMGMVMARAVCFSLNPVAIGFFAAVYAEKTTRLLIFTGISIGILTAMPAIEAAKYIMIMAVISVVITLAEGKLKSIRETAAGAIAGIVTCAFSITNGIVSADNEYFLLLSVLEGILVFSLTGIFHKGISYILYSEKGQAADNEQIISMAVMGALTVYSAPVIQSVSFSFVETTAFFMILLMGYKYGAGAGAITGAACGIIMELQREWEAFGISGQNALQLKMAGTLCIMGILAGMFREIGKVGTALAYGLGAACFGVMYQEEILQATGLSALVSSVILFLFLPGSIIYKTDTAWRGKNDEVLIKDNLQQIAKKKLKEYADSFEKLSHTFHSISDTKIALSRQDINHIFDDLSDKLCKDCENCGECWKDDFYDTYKAAFTLFSSAEKNGCVLEKDIPESFAGRCVNLDAFLSETNKSLALAKLNLNWYNRMAESREAIAGQLGEVASIIDDFAVDLYDAQQIETAVEEQLANRLKANHIEVRTVAVFEKKNKKKEIYMTARTEKGRCITTKEAAELVSEVFGKRMRPSDGAKNIISREYDTVIFVEDTNFKILTGMARVTKEDEKVSGDNFSFLNLSNGEMIMTLSDGMGTGVKACEESESVINLLEQFMEAGFHEESAIKLINSILVLKSESQSFSTIDMSIINQFTGICEFIKIGASTTFIKRDNWVETISSTTLPVGVFNQVDFDGVTKKMYDGDFIIMMTDGVLDCIHEEDKENFLEKKIMECSSTNPQEIANYILDCAMEQNNYKAADDMTILTAGIWKK